MEEFLDELYQRRFGDEIKFRGELWRILCKSFFQRYIPQDSVILDVAAGYCEFINNIKGRYKIALDINPGIKDFADDDVKVIISSSTNMKSLKTESVDVVFTSNFFEHLAKEDIIKTIKEINRVLKTGGTLLALQPNIRYCYKDFWMFYDHITPLDDRSLAEVVECNGFKIIECKPKFLPYTTKNKLPKSIFLLKLYLKLPILHSIFGKQAFIYAKKK